MASLVPVPGSDIKATYHSRDGHYLELVAEGTLPSWILTPFFKREAFTGGLLFSLRAFSGGLGPSKDQPFVSTLKVDIVLPSNYFNSSTVFVETSLGTFKIPITYVDLPSPPDSVDSDPPTIADDVLPPIKTSLTGDAELVISAKIPAQKGDTRSYVETSFNEAYFKLVNASVAEGSVNWTFKWVKFPEGKKNPQLINVVTSTWNGLLGPSAKWTRITQGYVVEYVLKAPNADDA